LINGENNTITMKKSVETPAKIWKSKYEELKTESELLKKLQDSQSKQGSEAALSSEVINSHLGIESKKNEIDDLEEKIVAKEEGLERTRDSVLLENLRKDKEILELRLKEKEKELAELKKKNKELEEEIRLRCQELQKQIDKKKEELQKRKDQIEKGSVVGKVEKKNFWKDICQQGRTGSVVRKEIGNCEIGNRAKYYQRNFSNF